MVHSGRSQSWTVYNEYEWSPEKWLTGVTLIKFTISHCLKRRQRETNKRKNYSVSHRKRRKEGSEAWFPGLWVGKIHWRRLSTPVFLGFPCSSAGKESTCNAGDLDSIPGLGRSPGEGKGYPVQYSGLENSTNGGAWWATVHRVTKSQTQLRDRHTHTDISTDSLIHQVIFEHLTIATVFLELQRVQRWFRQ